MTILAGSDAIAHLPTPDQLQREAAGRMHAVPRGVVTPGLSGFGEQLPPAQLEDEGCPRVETRLSLYLSADELLAGLWEASTFWETDDVSDETVRWMALTSLMIGGGPESPWTLRTAAEAREAVGTPEFEKAATAIERAFGITVPRA
ncbi:hypothetical protein DKG34_40555 [Streptomyces sp. NWU49]|uniref:hypothetical protein n=1 Tax=Streptomyces sp. NWU49 TaxID=2201153 RepID=UPI000D678B6A|nr:hypothetical protein [Streptomyces sp. NWU49]PWJ02096.1 hypothetical protein DKG34_40555 [Streptomyces sp. NWU49]